MLIGYEQKTVNLTAAIAIVDMGKCRKIHSGVGFEPTTLTKRVNALTTELTRLFTAEWSRVSKH